MIPRYRCEIVTMRASILLAEAIACLVNSMTFSGESPPNPACAVAIAEGEGALRKIFFLEEEGKPELAEVEEEVIVIERDDGKKEWSSKIGLACERAKRASRKFYCVER